MAGERTRAFFGRSLSGASSVASALPCFATNGSILRQLAVPAGRFEPGRSSPLAELRVGVVGLGSMGRRHAETYARLPGARLVAIATRDADKRRQAETEWGVVTFPDYRDLVGHVDAVTVATPTYLHAEIAEHLLTQGIHVLVEKPLAVTEQEAARVIAAAKAAGVCLMVGHIERFNPAFIRLAAEMRAAVPRQEKTRIRAYRMGPYDGRIHDVCVILDLMIHDIDLSLALHPAEGWDIHQALGMPVVSSRTDVGIVEYTLRSNGAPPAKVTLLASRTNETKRRVIEVQSGGFFGKADLFGQRVWVAPAGQEWRELPVAREAPLDLQLAHFVASVRAGTQPAVPGEAGAAALRLALDLVRRIQNTG